MSERLAEISRALAGRYVVQREIGRGGMATVYLAEDVRHRRSVAVKVLHAELGAALGGDRFLREIEVTAGLQHPHILPLHESGEASGLLYYVMPFVEGESLRQRLARERQLAVDEAIRISCDVASALDYAHRRGIVHRDVKPENVMLHDGRALVADFGIARAVQRAAGSDTLTATGVSIGTPQYMSPEQAAGERELDARSDIFSLGVVLYEMLAGEAPFRAPTAQGVVARVMTDAPRPISEERRAVPPHVGAAVMRALEKLPADRFATAAQLAAALSAPAGVSSANSVPRHRPALTRRDVAWAALAAALAVAAFLAAGRSRDSERAIGTGPVRFTHTVSDSQRLASAPHPVVISPDGRTIVFNGQERPGRRMLYLRPIDSLTARPIPGTESGVAPFFSPDGRWMGFVDDANGQLKKVSLSDGRVLQIGTHSNGQTWGANNVIVASSQQGLIKFTADGGPSTPLTTIDTARGDRSHRDPVFLSDGKTVAFRIVSSEDGDGNRIGLVSADAEPSGSERTPRHQSIEQLAGTPIGDVAGMLILGRPDRTIVAVPFDLRTRTLTGEPITVLERVVWNRGPAASLSASGAFVYVPGAGGSRLTIVDQRGAIMGTHGELRRYIAPRWSPDGKRIAMEVVSAEASGQDIWVYDLASGALSRLTSTGTSVRPEWTADGRRVAYIRTSAMGRAEVWWIPADKSGAAERLFGLSDDPRGVLDIAFSPSGGDAVLRIGAGPPRTYDLWLLSLAAAAERKATPLLATPFAEAMPRISRDGRLLAYVSNETGQAEVYVRYLRGPGGAVQVSTSGGAEPVWQPNGRELVYRTGDQFVAATVAVAPGSASSAAPLSIANRRVLFEGRFAASLPAYSPPQYDISPDGKHLVVLQPTTELRDIVVVLNWAAELRARTTARR